MDNINEIDQAALDKYFGLDANTHADASGSKTMTKNAGATTITYTYSRGGVVLTGVVDYATQQTAWSCTGVAGNTNRQEAIAEGLKHTVASINFT